MSLEKYKQPTFKDTSIKGLVPFPSLYSCIRKKNSHSNVISVYKGVISLSD